MLEFIVFTSFYETARQSLITQNSDEIFSRFKKIEKSKTSQKILNKPQWTLPRRRNKLNLVGVEYTAHL